MRCNGSAPALALILIAGACDSTQDVEKAARDASSKAVDASKKAAEDLADKAHDEAKALGKQAVDASKKAASDAVDASKQAASDLADDANKSARALFADLRDDGELSASSRRWLEQQAKDASDGIEEVLVAGTQLAPVALEASKVLSDAVDSETAVEPIFQKVDDDPAALDKKIGSMPRVEAIDGVTIGFKQMDTTQTDKQIKHRGYLVMWRHEDHLVGLVYRSTRTIDLETLVAETPRLVRLTQQALAAE